MPDKRLSLDAPGDADFRRSMTPVPADDRENPAAAASAEEFLQTFPAITHELSEALTAISVYLTGMRHLFEHGGRLDRIQGAVEQTHLQAARANEAVRRLRENFGKVGRP